MAGRSGVAAIDDLGRSLEIDLEVCSQPVVDLNELLIAGGINQGGGIALPVLLEHVAQGVDNFDAIVDSRVVAGGDHDTDGLAVELATPESSKEADTEGDSLEQVCLHPEASRAIGVEAALLERHDRVPGRGGQDSLVMSLHLGGDGPVWCCKPGLA